MIILFVQVELLCPVPSRQAARRWTRWSVAPPPSLPPAPRAPPSRRRGWIRPACRRASVELRSRCGLRARVRLRSVPVWPPLWPVVAADCVGGSAASRCQQPIPGRPASDRRLGYTVGGLAVWPPPSGTLMRRSRCFCPWSAGRAAAVTSRRGQSRLVSEREINFAACWRQI